MRNSTTDGILCIGIKEEVTAAGLKKAGHGFRQGIVFFVYHLPLTKEIVFFVDGLPPITTPTSGTEDSAVQPLTSNVEDSDSSHQGKVLSFPKNKIIISCKYFLYFSCVNAVKDDRFCLGSLAIGR